MNRRLAIGIGTAAAVLAAGGGYAVLTRSSTVEPRAAAAAPAAVAPVPAATPTTTTTAPVVHAASNELALVPAGRTATTFALPQRATKRFSMVSVSWTDRSAEPHGTVQVRTRTAKSGRWSGWHDLAIADDGADQPREVARSRGRTEPLWAPGSDGVAARLVAARGAAPAPLPAGLRLRLIDPDVSTTGGQGGGEPEPSASVSSDVPPTPTPTPTTEPVPTPTPTPTPTTTPPPVKVPLPPYVSRAGWGANEKLVTDPAGIAREVKMVWVHHTGFVTGSCAESPAIIRSIQQNDVDDGLSDLGYNFLVDKCGTLFEGRAGGVTQAVIGAHIIGFNTGSVGIALLGDYRDATKPSDAALMTIARVAAARLSAYGYDRTSSVWMTEGSDGMPWPRGTAVRFPRVSGHGDGFNTLCPGVNLNAMLPDIRTRSVQTITGLVSRGLSGGVFVGSTYHVRTAVTLSWTVTTPTASLARWEMLLDGQVAATLPAAARSGSLTLKPGGHTVAVRAVHVEGATAVTPAYQVVADVTAPTFPVAPNPVLRAGTYAATLAPVTVGYRAADNVKVSSVVATAPSRATLPPAGTAWNLGMRPGVTTTFTLTARDPAGNVRTASVQRTTRLLAETSAKRTGTWTAKSSGAYLGGKALTASTKNTKLTYTFTGRSAALLFARGAKTGKADVYLDGQKVATVDTKAATSAYRQALWVRALTPAKHTVVIVVAGTSGRPAVVSDGLAYVS